MQPAKPTRNRRFSESHLKSREMLEKEAKLSGGLELHKAASAGDELLISKLLDDLAAQKGDIDVRDKAGRTAFFLACKNGKLNTARLLLLRGAKPWIPDAQGAKIEDVCTASCRGFVEELKRTGQVPESTQHHNMWEKSPEYADLRKQATFGRRGSIQPALETVAEGRRSISASNASSPTAKRRNSLFGRKQKEELPNPFVRLEEGDRRGVFSPKHISLNVASSRCLSEVY